MSKPPLHSVASHHGQRLAQRGVAVLLGPSRDPPQKGLALRPALLKRREVRRRGGQDFPLGVDRGEGCCNRCPRVCRDMVLKHAIAGAHARRPHVLAADPPGGALYRPRHPPRRPQLVTAQGPADRPSVAAGARLGLPPRSPGVARPYARAQSIVRPIASPKPKAPPVTSATARRQVCRGCSVRARAPTLFFCAAPPVSAAPATRSGRSPPPA